MNSNAIAALLFLACFSMQTTQARIVYDAQTDWDEAIRLDSNDAVAYFNRGQELNEKGNLDQAIAEFSHAIRLEKGWAPPYGGRGIAYKSKKEYDKAISDLDENIRLDPKQDFYYRHRGDAFAFKGEYERALADFTEAIRLSPMEADGYLGRGDVYLEAGQYEHAINDFNNALSRDQKLGFAYKRRADAYRAKGDDQAAIADYSKAIELQPNSDRARAYFRRGNLYVAHGTYDLALADYAELAKLTPRDPAVEFVKGKIFYYQGQFESAAASFSKSLDLRAKDQYAGLWLFLAEARTGHQNEQRKLQDAAKNFDLQVWPGALVQLFLKHATFEDVEAAAALGLVAARQDQRCEEEFFLGEHALLSQKTDEAIQRLRTAVEICNPEFNESEGSKAELKRLLQ